MSSNDNKIIHNDPDVKKLMKLTHLIKLRAVELRANQLKAIKEAKLKHGSME